MSRTTIHQRSHTVDRGVSGWGVLTCEHGATSFLPLGSRREAEAAAELLRAGVAEHELGTVTGMGLRRGVACLPEDTIVRKVAAGALTIVGVMAALHGIDSPQHHAGRAIVAG